MTELSDKRIEDLIIWHKDQGTIEFMAYSNATSLVERRLHQLASEFHRDTVEALVELAEIRAEEDAMEDNNG